jgi:hypothetical protein
MAGELGAPGTTSHRGRGLQAGLLTALALAVAAFVAIVVMVLVALG